MSNAYIFLAGKIIIRNCMIGNFCFLVASHVFPYELKIMKTQGLHSLFMLVYMKFCDNFSFSIDFFCN